MAVLPTGIGPVTGYNIERSLRFNSADSAYLNRTPGSAGNLRKWTWSGWVKRSTLSVRQGIFTSTNTPGDNYVGLEFLANDKLAFDSNNGSVTEQFRLETNAVFRDPSAWYHIVIFFDTAQATASNRAAIYINGVLQTYSTATYMPQNYDGRINTTNQHNISSWLPGAALYFAGYMTEINFINNQVPTTTTRTVNGVTETILTQLGEFSSSTGVWTPKAWDGAYGTNGFYLKFADNSNTTAATLGKDSSGNGNNWTPNNFSVTAGSGNDSLVDSPTSYGTDTGVGGEVRGNYCTLNPLDNPNTTYAVSQNGNLYANLGTGAGTFLSGTMHVLGGKYYWEFTPTSVGNGLALGITYGSTTTTDANSKAIFYSFTGGKRIFGTDSAYGASYAANDVIGVAVDGIAGTIEFFKNGTSQGVITNSTISLQQFRPFIFNNTSSGSSLTFCNFGQRPFEKWNGSAYVANTAPSGFKALCTQNLPTPTIGATSTTQANDYMNVVTWSGNGSNPRTISGVGFQPDFVWGKTRSVSRQHTLFDAVRGAGSNKVLISSATDVEGGGAGNESSAYGYISAFASDGFTVASGTTNNNYWNSATDTYVAWNWNAGGSNQTISVGQYATSPANVPSIASTVRANTTSGFSIVTYTGNGTNGATVGHGLGTTPAMVIIKSRSLTGTTPSASWIVWHRSISQAIQTDTTIALTGFTGATVLNSTAQSTTYGFDAQVNGSTQTYVAYCFADVAGYSAFGSYTGNGAADGPFVYTGFRPAFVMVKNTVSAATSNWIMKDKLRAANYNPATGNQYANLAFADDVTATVEIDLLSNGFKIRGTYAGINGSTNSIIYAAFAENPFKYSLAR